MYQFYYADSEKVDDLPVYDKSVTKEYEITAIRPTMWEEHCLECSAPVCYGNCVHYIPRIDGRCMRFANGIYVYPNKKGCCGQGARVKFRKWANMMTIIFPAMLPKDEYQALTDKNQKLGNKLKSVANSKLPVKVRWESIRTKEFLRRRKLRNLERTVNNTPDAFVFHGYSFEKSSFHLIVEIYDDHTSVFKTAIMITPGENLHIIDGAQLSKACSTKDFLVKIYPENDLEAELDILWCDFVKGKRIVSEQPAAKVKCVVWDLDNTIWDGTLIETDNPNDLPLKQGVAEVIKALDERGIIQSVASKNDFDAAWDIVKKTGLSDYFIYPQIHWHAKSGSIEQIAKSLNIGIDTFALIDDSEFERNQVVSALPQVRVYDVTAIPDLMERPEFDVPITSDSKNRRLMYKAEEKRNNLMQSDNSDTVEFLKKCHLQIELFSPKTDEEKLRCYELLVRTNQLNLSGIKYTPKEFEKVFVREDCTNFAFSCKDDFGSYGIVGFGQYKVENKKLIFTEFAMSCRVAGKYVESALFSALLTKESCESGEFTVQKTKKNTLLRNTLQGIGFDIASESDGKVSYSFDINLSKQELVVVNWR